MVDPARECRDAKGNFRETKDCPYNAAPSTEWQKIVDETPWQIPDDDEDPAWKQLDCPRCGHEIFVKGPRNGPRPGVLFDSERAVFVYCNCGQEHPGGTKRQGCGQHADIRGPGAKR